MKIAAGGSSARSEVSRMMTEKVSAGAEAVAFDERRLWPKSHSSLPDARKGKCATGIEIGAGDPAYPNVAVRNENQGPGNNFCPPCCSGIRIRNELACG